MTKAKTKAEKLREKRARFAALAEQATPAADNTGNAPSAPPIERVKAIAPTPERLARGMWAKDRDRNAPMVDLAFDMIGALYAKGQITSTQHDAARHFQGTLAAYQAEIGIVGYRSCLHDARGGYDSSDGNLAIKRAYDDICKRLGVVLFLYLRTQLERGPEHMPDNMQMLKRALNGVTGEK